MIIGFTTGVFDLFHVGHLNLLRNAKALCDKLIVSVYVDEMVSFKKNKAIIPFEERIEIVRSIKYVDVAIPQRTMDKLQVWEKLKFDLMFVSDDWHKSERWEQIEREFTELGVRVVYFPYTIGTSSSLIVDKLQTL